MEVRYMIFEIVFPEFYLSLELKLMLVFIYNSITGFPSLLILLIFPGSRSCSICFRMKGNFDVGIEDTSILLMSTSSLTCTAGKPVWPTTWRKSSCMSFTINVPTRTIAILTQSSANTKHATMNARSEAQIGSLQRNKFELCTWLWKLRQRDIILLFDAHLWSKLEPERQIISLQVLMRCQKQDNSVLAGWLMHVLRELDQRLKPWISSKEIRCRNSEGFLQPWYYNDDDTEGAVQSRSFSLLSLEEVDRNTFPLVLTDVEAERPLKAARGQLEQRSLKGSWHHLWGLHAHTASQSQMQRSWNVQNHQHYWPHVTDLWRLGFHSLSTRGSGNVKYLWDNEWIELHQKWINTINCCGGGGKKGLIVLMLNVIDEFFQSYEGMNRKQS